MTNKLNKEEMFRKIMPSANAENPLPAQEAKQTLEEQTASEVVCSPQNNGHALTSANEKVQVNHSGKALAFSPRFAAARIDDGSPYPINVMELLMEKHYPAYCEKLEGCTCERCRDDIFGIALNKLPPHYIPSDVLQDSDLLDRELVTKTVTALVRAFFLVKSNPHHDIS